MAERGRPSIYSEELAARICERLALGESLRSVCRDDDMPSHSTVLSWADSNKEFSDQYAIARQRGYQLMADELMEIADNGRNDKIRDDDGNVIVDHDVIARSRLRVDTRKWMLSKVLPKIYGDRQTHEVELSANDRLLSLIEQGLTRAAR